MKSVILSTATRLLFPLLLMFSVFLLFRGHHLPGGGFIGGLVAASAFILLTMSFPLDKAKEILRIDPYYLVGTGLVVAAASGIPSLFRGKSYLEGLWAKPHVFGTELHLGTPLLFDIGVFLVVIGFTLVVIFTFEEEG